MLEILKALFKTGTASVISIIFGMITTKIIALTTGATGVGLFSQLRQIWQTNIALSTLSGQNALIQGVSSKDNKKKYLKTVFLIYLTGSLFISLILFLFADILTKLFFNSSESNYIRILAIINILSSLNIFFTGVLNGYRQIGKVAIIQIITAFAMLAASFPLIKIFNLTGLVLILFSAQLVTFIVSGLFIFRLNKFDFLRSRFDNTDAKNFISIALTTFSVGVVATVALLILKTIIIQKQGLATAGIFDAVWTLSTVYVMIILSSFSTYYLPTLSGIKNAEEQTALIQNILRLTILIIVPVICSIILFKPLIINILYSPEFIPALDIIRWMLIGDFFKVVSWILAMPAFAFANMKVYFWSEIISNTGFLILSAIAVIFFNNVEFIGITFVILYVCNLLYFLYYTKTHHNLQLTNKIILPWISGFGLIILTSAITWNDKNINWPLSLAIIIIAVIMSWMAINKNERSKLIDIIFNKK